MKKILLTGTFMVALLGGISLQSCNSEKKAETADTTASDTIVTDTLSTDTSKVITSKMTDTTDTGGKGTLAPPPKH
ncbi:MAG: hypothetical protein EOO86_00645 [Pedobacter sp.]|nr:MAG: hypothetical protein EOO86_00645 [Pedobacter sp.]